MTIAESLIEELKREAAVTRRLLERVPEDRLSWKPHVKSMTLGELAHHIAILPHAITELVSELVREVPTVPRPQAESVAELLSKLTASVDSAIAKWSAWDDGDLRAGWKLVREGKTLIEVPRGGVLRSVMLNHWYHHRGQLTVYLRLLDVPVPSTYGPSADENPFG